ncbi:MAG: hypothetical protein ACTSRO_10700 [Candidatus Heimdallarchaeaceae archaeon]
MQKEGKSKKSKDKPLEINPYLKASYQPNFKTKTNLVFSTIWFKFKQFSKRNLTLIWYKIKFRIRVYLFYFEEYVFPFLSPILFIFLFSYFMFIVPIIKTSKFLFNILFPPKIRRKIINFTFEKIVPVITKIALILLSSFFTLISSLGKLVLIIYDIFVPRDLRELVPILQMYRKYLITLANLLSGTKSREIIDLSHELDELVLREQKMMKAYPIRRGVGEVINLAITPIVIVAIPTAIWGDDLLVILEERTTIPPLVILFIFSTGLLIASWIATIFGPVYAIFHECSIILVAYGGYRWANIYRTLENFFSLPYHAAKSSFSFFDAPPISAETLNDFKLEILEEVENIKDKTQELLLLDSRKVPERSKKNLEKLLSKAELTLNELDISKITEKTARAFALLIWSKEASLLPWRVEEAKERFAKRNNMTKEKAEKSFKFIIKKLEEGYLSHDLFSSVMITGALKGIADQEKKYKQYMSDLEYNKLAISLALGSQQYIKDRFSPKKWYERIGKMLFISIIAPFLPYYVLIRAIYFYFRHIIVTTIKSIISIKYKEISTTLISTYENVKKMGRKLNFSKDLELDMKRYSKNMMKILFKLILLVPLLFWSFFKAIYQVFSGIWTRASEEEKMKRKFEKELATESLVAMYQELYDKMLLSDLLSS